MQNDYIAPIDHSAASADAATAAGAAGGAVKTGFKFGLTWMAATIGLGVLVGVGIATGGIGLLSSTVLWSAVGGGVAGGLLGGLGLTAVASIGAIIGAFKGGSRASERVTQERGKANELNQQVAAVVGQAQAMAPSAPVTNVYAPSATNDNKFSVPAEMNQASPKLMAGNDNRQYQDVVAAQQLAQGV